MSKRRFYFHLVLFISSFIVGGLSLWHDGLWMDGRNETLNFTAIAMVLMVIGQGLMVKAGLKKERD